MRLLDHRSAAASTRPAAAPAGAAGAPRKADLIEGFITGLAVINAFSDATPLLTASELAARLSISRAAARRFLITLHHAGYAATDGRSYWLTPKVLALGHSYLGSARLPRTVRPLLQQITAQTNESSNLALLDGHDVVYAARASAARLMSAAIETGTRLPAHTTAAGRVILAGLPHALQEQWLAGATLAPHTAYTVTTKKAFAAEIRAARAAGYAAVESQFEVGLRGIAVPLAGRDGGTIGALGISMAASSCPMDQAIRACVPVLRDAALQLRDLI
ncbi:MAG: helix-turn-helix domain-containing protein [Burkholderiales bacterium]|nr:helix-turn-helix domain-containing protein [Burkholderiales bacterium]